MRIIFVILIGLGMLGLLGWIGYHLLKRMTDSNKPMKGDVADKALEILKTKYAEGEISREEFNEIKNHLLE